MLALVGIWMHLVVLTTAALCHLLFAEMFLLAIDIPKRKVIKMTSLTQQKVNLKSGTSFSALKTARGD